MLGQDIDQDEVLEQNDDYVIYRSTAQGTDGNVEYLKMWGFMSDGSWFVMQSPLASIRESAALANQFLIYLGIAGIIIGGLLVWLLSRSYSADHGVGSSFPENGRSEFRRQVYERRAG